MLSHPSGVSVIPSVRRIRSADASDGKRILRSFLPQDDTQLLTGSVAGPGAAGVAKREDSYGPKSGPKAGSRASSPGEQAAACDFRKKLVSWAGEQAAACDYIRTRELGSTREL